MVLGCRRRLLRSSWTTERMVSSMIRGVAIVTSVVLAAALNCISVSATPGAGGPNNAQPPPAPASEGEAAVTHRDLQAGVGGTYRPVRPSTLPVAHTNPRNPLRVPPTPTNPQGQPCPNPANTFQII